MSIIGQDRERYRKVFAERDKQKDYWVYGVCGLCYCECAIRTRVVDGKPVAIEGVPESDKGSKGGSCARGVTSLMDYLLDNFAQPMVIYMRKICLKAKFELHTLYREK